MFRFPLVNHRSLAPRKFAYRPARATISAAAGTALVGAIVATTLAIDPTAASGPTAARSRAASFAMAGALDRAGSSQATAATSSQALRQYRAQAQAAEFESVARRALARIRLAHVAAAEHTAAERGPAAGRQASATPAAPSGSPQQIAMAMLADFGWSSSQFSCLDPLWERESGWNPYASNPSSGAYGIPQALPGSKMASAGADWATNAATQIRWGLGYIKATYGSPCGAWSHESADGWY